VEYHGQQIRWPKAGKTEVATITVQPRAEHAIVQVDLSVSNPGTERARYLRLPNASIGFPHVPGSGATGQVVEAASGFQKGELVTVRAWPHQSMAMAPVERLRRVPQAADPVDAALWQLGLIAMHGLGMGGFLPGEPLTVVGAGLVGAMARRVAIARGTLECTVVAASTAKRWSVENEPATRFVTTDAAEFGQERHRLVIDATGTAAGLTAAVTVAADDGRIVLLGSPRTPAAAVPVREIYERRLRLVGAHIDTLPDVSAASGEDLVARYTNEFFDLIGSGQLTAADLMTIYTPGQAGVLYHQLAEDRCLVGAGIRWSRPTPTLNTPRPSIREPERPLRFGLVGCGDIGFRNADTFGRSSRALFVACYDTDPALAAALADRTGVRTTTSLTELLGDPEVEAVLVATPHDTHEQIALATLNAGKHLLLQKPLAADLAAAQRIARAAGRASATTSVLLPGRYEAAYRNARRVRDAGLMGQPSAIVATYLVDKPSSYYQGGYSMRSVSTWRMSKERSGGGVLIMNLLHHLDMAQSLVRAGADWVFARTATSPHSPEIEDIASVIVGFGDVTATFVAAASVPGPPGEQFRVWGPAGHCVLLPDWQFTSAVDGNIDPRLRPEPDDPDAAAINGFADAVRSGRAPDVTADEALAIQAIIAAGYESARTGRPVAPRNLLEEGGNGA
jgi:predicted dehydrogenase/NADPH:quinone reductase-like Zn-dependent oxidoreductase